MSAGDYNCPEWCIRTDHNADEVGPGHPPVHYGPEFGAVSPQFDGSTFEAIVYIGGEGLYAGSSAELRRVAADMVRAAEWLEARA